MNVGQLREALDDFGDHVDVVIEVENQEFNLEIDSLEYFAGSINAVVIVAVPEKEGD
jgi:hypothetical protein